MSIHISYERFAFSTYIHVKGDEGASGKGHDIDTMNLRQGVHFELLFNGAAQKSFSDVVLYCKSCQC